MAEPTTVVKKIPPVIHPDADLGKLLDTIIGETGAVAERDGGYYIDVLHTNSFPWDEVFKALLYRDFRVAVTRHKADLYVEATP